ncbi:MAG: histidinol dehydrogenase [Dehalococcoidia bacterium]
MSLTPLPIVRGSDAARRTIRQQRSLQATKLTPAEASVIRNLFGEALSADEAVRRIIAEVRAGGDEALRRISLSIDGYAPERFLVGEEEFAAARASVDAEVVAALQVAAERVRRYHERQLAHAATSFNEGATGQIVRPLRRVGLYAPGTVAVYPSSVLHTAIPAVVAGVEDVCIASPGRAGGDGAAAGEVSPLKLVAAEIAGVKTVYRVGGAQAIAALAYGTESIPAVDKIFGPGNRFVTLAKRLVFGDAGIDAIYGPTETVVIADESADAEYCAADLLAQAEHDELAAPILITPSEGLAAAVAGIVPERAAEMERGAIALAAFRNRGGIWLVEDLAAAIELANEYAPEHLALLVREPERYVERIRNAGGLFVGETSPEALADYVAGPSHVMPTGGSARYASPLHVGEFLKITTVLRASEALLEELAPSAITIARAEGLTGHARSLEVRRRDR